MANYRIIGGDNKEYGPASEQEVRRWIAEGRLNGQSSIQPEGTTGWRPLSELPEFADVVRGLGGQPPVSGPSAPPVNADVLAEEILARPLAVNIGACLSRSWRLLQANLGLLFGATVVVWLISLCQFVPLVGLVYRIFAGALFGGFYLVFLRRIRGEPAAVGDVFLGFSLAFGQLVLAGLVSTVLSWVGFCFCLIPGIYLAIAWLFSVPLVIDKRLEFWSAMELSRKAVTRVWFELFGLVLVAFLPVIVATLFGELKVSLALIPRFQELISSGPPDFNRFYQALSQLSGVQFAFTALARFVLLVTWPFAIGALMYAYEDLFGTRTTPAP